MKQPRLLHAARAASLTLLFLAPTLTLAAPPPFPNQSTDHTLGTVNCASSVCHGAVVPWDGGNILHNEYTTWLREDSHAGAYNVLETAASRRMIEKLGLDGPATAQKVCLDCHTHNPPSNRSGVRFVRSEGIGCEGCHGPAERWIGPHTEKDASTSRNHALGMYPTSDPVAQARLCLSCHFGDSSRLATHRIMGAGHPRLSFEIKTFSTLQPTHFRVDEDYEKRKNAYDPVRLWAIGQALAAKNRLDTLTDPVRRNPGLFPELAAFDCYACHRLKGADRWVPRLGIGPGRVRLDDSHLLMLRALLAALDPVASPAFDAEVAAMHRAIAGDGGAAETPPLEQVAELSRQIDQHLTRIAAARYTPALQRRILAALLEQAERSSYADYAGAEQAYMAITTLANALIGCGTLHASPALAGAMGELLAVLTDADKYQPEEFRRHLAAMRAMLFSREGS